MLLATKHLAIAPPPRLGAGPIAAGGQTAQLEHPQNGVVYGLSA